MFWNKDDNAEKVKGRSVKYFIDDVIKNIGIDKTITINNVKFHVANDPWYRISGKSASESISIIITLINDDDELVVFKDDEWLYQGSWCDKIYKIIDDIKEQKQRAKVRKDKEFADKLERFEKAFGDE
jgi:hypothetical protein